MKNFAELLDVTKNRVNYTDPDPQIDLILKEALNEAYKQISKEICIVQIAYIPIIQEVAALPDDSIEVISTKPELLAGDEIRGQSILTKHNGVLEVQYVSLPEPMIKETDPIEIPEKYHFALTTYAASIYFGFKKKIPMAEYYMSQWFNNLQILKIETSGTEKNVIKSMYHDMF